MIDPKALRALSYFSLAKLEQIYRDYFDYDDEIDIFEGIKEASSCLIPHKNILESYVVFKQILAGSNGFHVLGNSPKERVMMLIEMMKIYERQKHIENLITHHFCEKSYLHYEEFQSLLNIGYISNNENNSKVSLKKPYPIYKSILLKKN
jgi:hypothetical protein